jgi:drug/metabolite transporter (DMT)-like permease
LPGSPEQEKQPPAVRGRAAWLALLALPVVPILWGYNWVVMKSGVAYMAPFEFAAWRFIPAGLLLLGILALARRPVLVRGMDRVAWARPMASVAWAGILQTAVNTALSLFALAQGPAGRAALLCYTMPFWVVLLGWPLLRERPGRIQVAALVAAAAGLALVFAAGAGAQRNLAAVVLATLSGLAWAWGTVLTRRLLVEHHADPLAVAAWQMIFGGVVLAAAALVVPGRPATWSPYLVFAVLYEILPATAVAWVLWTALLRHVSAGVASLAILATPLVGLLASALQLGERPRGLEAAGLASLVVALVLVGPLAVRQARRGAANLPPRTPVRPG